MTFKLAVVIAICAFVQTITAKTQINMVRTEVLSSDPSIVNGTLILAELGNNEFSLDGNVKIIKYIDKNAKVILLWTLNIQCC